MSLCTQLQVPSKTFYIACVHLLQIWSLLQFIKTCHFMYHGMSGREEQHWNNNCNPQHMDQSFKGFFLRWNMYNWSVSSAAYTMKNLFGGRSRLQMTCSLKARFLRACSCVGCKWTWNAYDTKWWSTSNKSRVRIAWPWVVIVISISVYFFIIIIHY